MPKERKNDTINSLSKEVERMDLSMKNILENLENKYNYLRIDEKEYQKMAKSVLETMKNEDNKTEENFLSKMEGKIKEKKKVILKNPEHLEQILTSFMDENMKENEDVEFLYQLSEFLKKINNAYTIDTFITLLNKNEKFHELLRQVVEKNMDYIKRRSLKTVFKSESILSMINAYCILHDIEEEKNDLDLENKEIYTSSYRSYISEISRYPILTREEEKALFYRIRNHDEEARKKLIECNLRLVVSIALKYSKNDHSLLDFIQDGNIGLMKAIDKFDIEKGYKFSTYAPWWIKHAIQRGIENKGRIIRFPSGVYYDLKDYRKAIEELQNSLSRNPTLKELSVYLRKSEKSVLHLAAYDDDILSTNFPINDEESSIVEDFITDEKENIEDKAMRSSLNEGINVLFKKAKLNEREKNILLLRNEFYGRIYSLEEIGKMYGITRERARQIESKALYKLRNTGMVRTFSIYMDYPMQAEENLKIILEEYQKDKKSAYSKSYTTHGNGLLNQRKKENDLLKCIKVSVEEEEYKRIREYLSNEKAKRLLEFFEPIEAFVYTLKKYYTTEYVAYLLGKKKEEVDLILARALDISKNHPKSMAKLERKK